MSDTPQTDKLGNELVPLKAGENDFVSALKNWRDLCRKLERERDDARKEIERLKAEAELYSGWPNWKDGIWRISHPDSEPLAEWIAEDIEGLKADKERLDWLEKLDPDSSSWLIVIDSLYIRGAIDAAMKGAE